MILHENNQIEVADHIHRLKRKYSEKIMVLETSK